MYFTLQVDNPDVSHFPTSSPEKKYSDPRADRGFFSFPFQSERVKYVCVNAVCYKDNMNTIDFFNAISASPCSDFDCKAKKTHYL